MITWLKLPSAPAAPPPSAAAFPAGFEAVADPSAVVVVSALADLAAEVDSTAAAADSVVTAAAIANPGLGRAFAAADSNTFAIRNFHKVPRPLKLPDVSFCQIISPPAGDFTVRQTHRVRLMDW